MAPRTWEGFVGILLSIAVVAGATTVGVIHARQAKRAAANNTAVAVARVDAAQRLRQQRDAAQLAAITPRLIPVLDQTLSLEPRAYSVSIVTVPPGDHCDMIGWAKGLTPQDDFVVAVLPQDDIVRWKASGGGHVILQTGGVAQVPINVALPTPGKYGLAISNKTSAVVPHDVQVKAQLRCTSDWPRS